MEITTANYLNPSLENQSFTILQIVIAAIKKTLVEFNTISNFPKEDEEVLVNLGIKVLKGEKSSEEYSSKVIKLVEKLTGKIKNKSEKEYLDRKIQGYLKRDLLENKQVDFLIKKLEEKTNKKVILR